MRLGFILMILGIVGLEVGTWVLESPYLCAVSAIVLCASVFHNAYTFKSEDEKEK